MIETSFFAALRSRIKAYGGVFNAHLHLDRAGTLDDTLRLLGATDSAVPTDRSALSLAAKHAIIPLIHTSGCYEPPQLRSRVAHHLDLLVDAGTTRADTVVDTTTDRVCLSAVETCLDLKATYRDRLDLRVGAYSPLGFKDTEPDRWSLVEEAAQIADFIGGLPERDDRAAYPNHIGYEESCRRLLTLSAELKKPLHLHVDQKNIATEDGTERALRVAADVRLPPAKLGAEPSVWLVHAISPSAYDEPRFRDLVGGIAAHGMGVICCPSAAISMRQYRPFAAPTHNSIARVLEMLAAGIPVRVGSDNICDITSPAGTTDLVQEIFVLANAIRFYDLEILAKLGAGLALDTADRERVVEHLECDAVELHKVVSASRFRQAA
jgi:cytosine/adenosine deaminase-related metal-dependent hydrolase